MTDPQNFGLAEAQDDIRDEVEESTATVLTEYRARLLNPAHVRAFDDLA